MRAIQRVKRKAPQIVGLEDNIQTYGCKNENRQQVFLGNLGCTTYIDKENKKTIYLTF